MWKKLLSKVSFDKVDFNKVSFNKVSLNLNMRYYVLAEGITQLGFPLPDYGNSHGNSDGNSSFLDPYAHRFLQKVGRCRRLTLPLTPG